MIRKAILKDVNSIEDTYNEHFQYELNHTAFTVFKKGVYPTKDDAERAIYAGALFVYEENGTIVGSIIIDKVQPIEYATIPWKEKLSEDEVMVIHLLMVRPSMSGKGIASSLIKFATELARKGIFPLYEISDFAVFPGLRFLEIGNSTAGRTIQADGIACIEVRS